MNNVTTVGGSINRPSRLQSHSPRQAAAPLDQTVQALLTEQSEHAGLIQDLVAKQDEGSRKFDQIDLQLQQLQQLRQLLQLHTLPPEHIDNIENGIILTKAAPTSIDTTAIICELQNRIEDQNRMNNQRLKSIDALVILDIKKAMGVIIDTFALETDNIALKGSLVTKLYSVEVGVAMKDTERHRLQADYQKILAQKTKDIKEENTRRLRAFEKADIRNLLDEREGICSFRKNKRRFCSSTAFNLGVAFIMGILSSKLFPELPYFTGNHT